MIEPWKKSEHAHRTKIEKEGRPLQYRGMNGASGRKNRAVRRYDQLVKFAYKIFAYRTKRRGGSCRMFLRLPIRKSRFRDSDGRIPLSGHSGEVDVFSQRLLTGKRKGAQRTIPAFLRLGEACRETFRPPSWNRSAEIFPAHCRRRPLCLMRRGGVGKNRPCYKGGSMEVFDSENGRRKKRSLVDRGLRG